MPEYEIRAKRGIYRIWGEHIRGAQMSGAGVTEASWRKGEIWPGKEGEGKSVSRGLGESESTREWRKFDLWSMWRDGV